MPGQRLISIVIPVYNRIGFIGETLKSVMEQTYAYWEAIVVDDGSTDGSREFVKSLASSEPRIRFFDRDRLPKGAPVCRNIGIERSSGEYLIFLDSDDILAPFCLQQRTQAIGENGGVDFLVFKTQIFEDNIDDLGLLWNVDMPNTDDDLLRFLSYDAMWQTTGPIYRKSSLSTVGGFKEDLPFWQDFHLHLVCLLSGMNYIKRFDLPVDNYHRKNRKDGISRVTPFIDDPAVLQTRIDFYISLFDWMKSRKIPLDNRQRNAIKSVLFFFTSSFLIRHHDFRRFVTEWRHAAVTLRIGYFGYCFNVLYGYLKMLSMRHYVFHKVCRLYEIILNDALADIRIISRNRIGKVKLNSDND